MRIHMIEREEAKGEVLECYDGQVNEHGRITNMKKSLLNHIPSFKVLMEWYPLKDEVVKVVGEFSTYVYAHAISTQNECLICSTFFRRIIMDAGKDPDNLELTDTEKLLVEYGRACVNHPAVVSDDLFNRMRERFSESEIVLLTSFAGMMIATNLINSALEVPLDSYLDYYVKK